MRALATRQQLPFVGSHMSSVRALPPWRSMATPMQPFAPQVSLPVQKSPSLQVAVLGVWVQPLAVGPEPVEGACPEPVEGACPEPGEGLQPVESGVNLRLRRSISQDRRLRSCASGATAESAQLPAATGTTHRPP